jgi:hypothetical protein
MSKPCQSCGNDPCLHCEEDRRREQVRRRNLNGLDYLEVDGKSLVVYFINQAPTPDHLPVFHLTGGTRIPANQIHITGMDACAMDDPELDRCLRISLDRCGDLSTYCLCVEDDDYNHFDPRYRCLEFSFAVLLPSELDCQSGPVCQPEPLVEPEINYLAKDFSSFRQVILDRMALTLPHWQERHIPDIGITLVEILAYVGDYLSYYQDAVSTESYLQTARRRISVRRHARLVDYFMHEGCNARAWVNLQVDQAQLTLDPANIFFITGMGDALPNTRTLLSEDDLRLLSSEQYEAFEPLVQDSITVYQAHNELHFYTWGDEQCCLAKGATQAFLRYPWRQPTANTPAVGKAQMANMGAAKPDSASVAQAQNPDSLNQFLKPGDVLVFAEVKGPRTGAAADADPRHRIAVRLTDVEYLTDTLYEPPVPLVKITWALDDAMPFPLCLSAIGSAPGCKLIEDISLAYGNTLLVDHGRHQSDPEPLVVPPDRMIVAGCLAEGQPADPLHVPERFYPRLGRSSVVFTAPFTQTSARGALMQDPHRALPSVTLRQVLPGEELNHTPSAAQLFPVPPEVVWSPRLDLLGSGGEDAHFVVEMDDERVAWLRFGDGDLGAGPPAGALLYATYRVGGGTRGNIGADSIAHLVYRRDMVAGVNGVRNLLAASGGADPELVNEVRLFAPETFRHVLRRAITPADYAVIAMSNPRVQRAAAALRWTGSWYEMQVAIDPLNSSELEESLRAEIEDGLQPYRRLGTDLRVIPAAIVPLNIQMQICIKPHYLRGHVRAALLDAFSNRRLADGNLGLFHADQLTFGQSIYLSKLIAVAQSIPGVQSARIVQIWRQWEPYTNEENQVTLESGLLEIGPLELARLDNDPNQPEYGLLHFDLSGGR